LNPGGQFGEADGKLHEVDGLGPAGYSRAKPGDDSFLPEPLFLLADTGELFDDASDILKASRR
jgi:hypothetical protein